jgi:hypothetical protein
VRHTGVEASACPCCSRPARRQMPSEDPLPGRSLTPPSVGPGAKPASGPDRPGGRRRRVAAGPKKPETWSDPDGSWSDPDGSDPDGSPTARAGGRGAIGRVTSEACVVPRRLLGPPAP